MNQFWGSIGLGGLATLVIAQWYYVRSSRDQKTICDKLSSELKIMILSDKRVSLSVRDLNALLRDRIIDSQSTDLLPYKACPKCGSGNIYPNKDFLVDAESGDDGTSFHTATPYRTIECEDCGWRDDEITKDIDRITE